MSLLTSLTLQTTTTSSSDDPFEAISGFFDSSLWSVGALVLQAFVVLMWVALCWWTFQDARRRIREPALIAGAVALSVLIPYLGSLIYLVVRPPEYLVEARERELELLELERRMGELGDSEGQRLVGRMLARERGDDPDDPSVRSALKKAGVATREELQDLDLRLTELEFRMRTVDRPPTGRDSGAQRPRSSERPGSSERPSTTSSTEDTGRRPRVRRARGTAADPEIPLE